VIVTSRFRVLLHGQDVGILHRRGDHTQFVLDPDYWAQADRPILGLAFEDRPGERHAAALRLPPWFSNLLPEGPLRDWIAQERHVSPQREAELLAQVGHDLPGAVTVVPEPGDCPDWPDPDTLRRPPDRPAPEGGRWRFSLAGVALKFSMLRQGDRLTLPATGHGGDWIVKLPDARHPRVPRNEYVTMLLARAAGIEVPEIHLCPRKDLPDLPSVSWPHDEDEAFAIRRFDRDDARRPVHIEDLAQVRGLWPEQKYTGTFETVANLVHRGRDRDSLHQFVRRLAFCVLVGNGDAHLKNWSLIYEDPRIPRLSPAYDLVATAAYVQDGDEPEDLGLKFCGSRRMESVTLASFEQLERRLRLNGSGLRDTALDAVERTLSAWPDHAHLLDDLPELHQSFDRRLRRNNPSLGITRY
jgi:serine/threonine-protein kinase HipA